MRGVRRRSARDAEDEDCESFPAMHHLSEPVYPKLVPLPMTTPRDTEGLVGDYRMVLMRVDDSAIS